MSNQKFFMCKSCGKLVGIVINKGVELKCCGEDMVELIPNTVEASLEKHIPEVEVNGELVTVKVGSIPHPMEEAHHIDFIYVETKNGGQRKALKVGSEPKAEFKIINDEVIAVYAYCNLHGLWKKEIV